MLEEKIDSVTRLVVTLREKANKSEKECDRLRQENELLGSENKMVRKLMAELDRFRDERKLIKSKCEKLMTQFDRLNV